MRLTMRLTFQFHPTVTLSICRAHVDEWVSVTEEEIADAVFGMLKHHHKVLLIPARQQPLPYRSALRPED